MNLIRIKDNVINTDSIITIIVNEVIVDRSSKPAVQIKLKDGVTINMLFNSMKEAKAELNNIWDKVRCK